MSTQEQQITPENALQIIAQALREIPLPVESKNPQQLTHSVLSRCITVLVEAIKPNVEEAKESVNSFARPLQAILQSENDE